MGLMICDSGYGKGELCMGLMICDSVYGKGASPFAMISGTNHLVQ